MRRVKVKDALKTSIKRAFFPNTAFKAYKLERNKKRHHTAREDQQLKLYANIFEGGFLHYGYFDDPNTNPADISLNSIFKAFGIVFYLF